MIHWVNLKEKFSTDATKLVGNMLRPIHVQEGLRKAEHLKRLNILYLHTNGIGDLERGHYKKKWGFYRMSGKCPKFVLTISTGHSSCLA